MIYNALSNNSIQARPSPAVPPIYDDGFSENKSSQLTESLLPIGERDGQGHKGIGSKASSHLDEGPRTSEHYVTIPLSTHSGHRPYNSEHNLRLQQSFLSQTMSFIQHTIRPGTIRGSIISLVAATIGASTLTIPYIMAICGILGGLFWIVIGASMTFYAGHLLIKCGEITGKQGSSYEHLAKISLGKKWKPVVSVFMLTSLLGFVVAYMTLIKTMVPALIQDAIGQDRLPYWLQRNEIGGIVYSTIFAFFIILPLSTARQMGSLKYMSALGLIGSIVLMIVIIYEFATNSLVVPDISVKLKSAQLLIVSWSNTIETIPFIIFLYMYQALLPQYYKELNRRSISRMDKVVKRASTAMILVYVPMGIFGYLTFADNLGQTLLSEKTSGNILKCKHHA